jgi:hypothetical protein
LGGGGGAGNRKDASESLFQGTLLEQAAEEKYAMKFLSWLFGSQESGRKNSERPILMPRGDIRDGRVTTAGRQDQGDGGWDAAKPPRNQIDRPDGFVVHEIEVRIAGMSHRDGALPFVRAARAAFRGGRGWPTIRLEREPENPASSMAIKVVGRLPQSQTDVHLGYLPADVSQLLAERFDAAMPLAAILRSVGTNNGGGIFATIETLIPKAKDRKAFER